MSVHRHRFKNPRSADGTPIFNDPVCEDCGLHPELADQVEIRGTHPYTFRSGEWARLAGFIWMSGRLCYWVEFIDGRIDQWPVYDAMEPYEFRSVAWQSHEEHA